MIGAQIFNELEGNEIKTIFGCVTTGEDWQFLKLESNIINIDVKRYYIDNVEKILDISKKLLPVTKPIKKNQLLKFGGNLNSRC